jgi:hypothetical protein
MHGTVFLLQYLSDPSLRQQITESTNNVEAYNGFAKWLFFGGEGIIADNRRGVPWAYSLSLLERPSFTGSPTERNFSNGQQGVGTPAG